MNNVNDNKKVFSWKPMDTENEIFVLIHSKFDGQFRYIAEYFGDHAENWIVKYDTNGKEQSRTNTKTVEYIQWSRKD